MQRNKDIRTNIIGKLAQLLFISFFVNKRVLIHLEHNFINVANSSRVQMQRCSVDALDIINARRLDRVFNPSLVTDVLKTQVLGLVS